jgi:hypothetical protein
MPPLTMEPIIVEPKNPDRREVDRSKGEFVLYDYQWPVETDPKYKLPPGTPPLRVPHFPPGEVSSWAFGQTSEWMKDRLKGPPVRKRLMLTPDQPLEIRTVARGRTGERRFTLADIERLAWALYDRGDIDGHQLQCACAIVLAVAEQYKRRLKP